MEFLPYKISNTEKYLNVIIVRRNGTVVSYKSKNLRVVHERTMSTVGALSDSFLFLFFFLFVKIRTFTTLRMQKCLVCRAWSLNDHKRVQRKDRGDCLQAPVTTNGSDETDPLIRLLISIRDNSPTLRRAIESIS